MTVAPGLESLGGWMAAAGYIAALAIFLFLRFRGGQWKSKRLLKESAVGDAETGPVPVMEPQGVDSPAAG